MTFFLQAATDSVAVVVGAAVGGWATTLLVSVLGVVNKFVTDGAKAVLGKFGTLPDWSKALIALAFAQAVTFLNAKFGVGASADVNELVTSAQGTLVWAISMGWHALSKVLFPAKAA
jgi:hypothetical protein